MLKENTLQSELLENGFVKFPFLNTSELIELQNLFNQFEAQHIFNGKYHHSTFHTGNESLAREVDAGIRKIILPAIEKHFFDYQLFVANFMLKEPGEESEVVPHQDWNYVEEPEFMSLNIWVPLQDVDTHNGCMTFLPKSHTICPTLRTSPTFPGLFDLVMPHVREQMVAVPMQAGEALLFSHATLHGSVPNKSNERRLNIVQGIYTQGAQLQHSFMDADEGNKIKVYPISNEDFYQLKDLKKPTYANHLKEIEFDFRQLREAEFYSYYKRKSKLNFIEKVKQLFA